MSISEYFTPLDNSSFNDYPVSSASCIGNIAKIFRENEDFPKLEGIHMAIVGVEEDRRAVNNEGCALAPNAVRKKLYELYQGDYAVKMADLGNIKRGFSVEDTYFAVSTVVTELVRKNIIPIIIGGGQDISYANYLAYENLQQTINIVAIDSRFDIGNSDSELSSQTFLGKIILQQPNFLFNYSNIGYQTYFTDQTTIELMSKLFFDIYRLGQVRSDLADAEPVLRNADMITFDISSVRQSDAPGNINASPNGFFGDEACKLARYAGLSDKLSSIGFYETNPMVDNAEQSSSLVAQIIWHFIDGYYNRKNDYPATDKSMYLKYFVSLNESKHEIIFYKSNKSDRWWMSVPYPPNEFLKYERHHLVPCSYKDYQAACNNEMPDRWYKTFQKLS